MEVNQALDHHGEIALSVYEFLALMEEWGQITGTLTQYSLGT